MTLREIDAATAEKLMGWLVVPFTWDDRHEDTYPRVIENINGDYTCCLTAGGDWSIWNPSSSIFAAMQVVDRLRAAEIEVIIGCFRLGFSIELRRWRDRRAEGVTGDPYSGRSRETFYCKTGLDSLPRGICEAALDPTSIKMLRASSIEVSA